MPLKFTWLRLSMRLCVTLIVSSRKRFNSKLLMTVNDVNRYASSSTCYGITINAGSATQINVASSLHLLQHTKKKKTREDDLLSAVGIGLHDRGYRHSLLYPLCLCHFSTISKTTPIQAKAHKKMDKKKKKKRKKNPRVHRNHILVTKSPWSKRTFSPFWSRSTTTVTAVKLLISFVLHGRWPVAYQPRNDGFLGRGARNTLR